MTQLTRITISLENTLLEAFDRSIEAKGYPTRRRGHPGSDSGSSRPRGRRAGRRRTGGRGHAGLRSPVPRIGGTPDRQAASSSRPGGVHLTCPPGRAPLPGNCRTAWSGRFGAPPGQRDAGHAGRPARRDPVHQRRDKLQPLALSGPARPPVICQAVYPGSERQFTLMCSKAVRDLIEHRACSPDRG